MAGDAVVCWVLSTITALLLPGEVVVFNINGRDIPIVHRVIKVHERTNENHLDILTKVRHTWDMLAVKAVWCGALLLLGWHLQVPLAPTHEA